MLFVFGSTSESFYIAHGRGAYWKGLPDSLVTYLNKEHRWLRSISIGENGAWFYKEMATNESSGSYLVASASSVAYRRVREIYDSDEAINWVAFGPDGAYVVETTKTVYASSKSMVRNYEGSNTRVPLRSASFGYDGSWAVVEDDGEVRSHGLSDSIAAALKSSPVRKVSLSPHSATAYFVEYTNGTTTWTLPVSWHPDVIRIERISLQLDKPLTSGGSTTVTKTLFAFGPTKDMYCISKGAETIWRGVDEDLTSHLRKQGDILSVSMGEGGANFCKGVGKYYVSPATKIAYPDVWKLWKDDVPINWLALGPHGYYVCDTRDGIYASRSDYLLRKYAGGKQVPLRCASFGYGGSCIVVEDDGVIRSRGLSAKVRKAMFQQEIRNIQLSRLHEDHFYVEYMDGSSDRSLPSSWHDAIQRMKCHTPKLTPVLSMSLEKLGEAEYEYARVHSQFVTSWRQTTILRPSVRSIHKIQYYRDLYTQYMMYLSRVENEQQLFHDTPRKCRIGDHGEDTTLCYQEDCRLCEILRTNFSTKDALTTGN
ncbi:hypothetical protein FRB94_001798 [Tulasnella sp. JGI-2019a]|nr:hypothetical protein FRB93_003784 [Tulasnella sp. JGI-2019a]KAG9005181.1 hypothetical protein FRB94_001798 [Tulasnella sp. JGI-2019a]